LGTQLRDIGQTLRNIKAVLVISPHWQTNDIEVMTNSMPETIHDFYGFPKSLYDLLYPVNGATTIAKNTIEVLEKAGYKVKANSLRGLDHGTWVPLMDLLPHGSAPVFQVSMPRSLEPKSAYSFGQALASLRREGVMIIASGGMTHNLHDFRQGVGGDLPYVDNFANWVKQAVQNEQLDQLFRYQEFAPNAYARIQPMNIFYLFLLP
jgi:4,5-DOPA dioxygenase extradiol